MLCYSHDPKFNGLDVAHAFPLSSQEAGAGDLCELEASLLYKQGPGQQGLYREKHA